MDAQEPLPWAAGDVKSVAAQNLSIPNPTHGGHCCTVTVHGDKAANGGSTWHPRFEILKYIIRSTFTANGLNEVLSATPVDATSNAFRDGSEIETLAARG